MSAIGRSVAALRNTSRSDDRSVPLQRKDRALMRCTFERWKPQR